MRAVRYCGFAALTRSGALCKAAPPREVHVTSRKGKTPDFEQALGELEAVVERLEHGELPLEDALKQFARGIELARACQDSLKQAEQKVEILLQKNPDATPEPFPADAAD
jgi:exodeoxyribonuclease VII small subunit